MAYESMVHPANMALGRGGSTAFTGTTARTGNWHMFTVIGTEAAVFTTLTDTSRDGDALGATSFPVGVTILGQFTAITLASGAIIAYKTPVKP